MTITLHTASGDDSSGCFCHVFTSQEALDQWVRSTIETRLTELNDNWLPSDQAKERRDCRELLDSGTHEDLWTAFNIFNEQGLKENDLDTFSFDEHEIEIPFSAELSDEEAAKIGHILASGLMLRTDPEQPRKWFTAWGFKSNPGLARTVLGVITNPDHYHRALP